MCVDLSCVEYPTLIVTGSLLVFPEGVDAKAENASKRTAPSTIRKKLLKYFPDLSGIFTPRVIQIEKQKFYLILTKTIFYGISFLDVITSVKLIKLGESQVKLKADGSLQGRSQYRQH